MIGREPSVSSALGLWAIYRPMMPTLHAATLELARTAAGRRYPVGFVRIEHETTGESWARRAGNWSQDRPATAGHHAVTGGAT
jgi:hypothetical protein